MVTSAVVFQAFALGLEIELAMEHEFDRVTGSEYSPVPHYVIVINVALTTFFMLEVCFRIVVLKRLFFWPRDTDARAWNYFDLVIVICCIPDYFPTWGASKFAIVRAIRLLRLLRILRVARAIKELRKMV